MTTPKHLRKISDGRIFAYTQELAKRSDMVVVWEQDEEPQIELGTGGGLEIDPSDFDRKTKKLLEQKDKMIIATEKEMDKLVSENQELLDRVAELEAQFAGLEPADNEEEKKPTSPETRMEVLIATVKAMITGGNSLDFTGAGMPRVERLEEISGIAEVSAEERNEAYRIAQGS